MVIQIRQWKLSWFETDCTMSKGSASVSSFYILLLEVTRQSIMQVMTCVASLRLLFLPCDCILNSRCAVNLFSYMIVSRLT